MAEPKVETQQQPPAKPFVVKGRVTHADGKPLFNATVRAFDRDLRTEEPLGDTTTDGTGHYEIRYSADQFQRHEKASADLVVRAFSRDANEPLATSPILFNAGPEATVDLVLGNEAYRGPSEYEQLVAELTPLLQDIAFAVLTEDGVHQDVSFLSGETGQDPLRITFLILAHRLRERTKLPAEIFYGMFRQGLPTQLPALLAQSPAVQRRAIVRSAEENIIPFSFAEQADAILESFRALRVQLAMEATGGATATLNDLLSVTLKDADLRKELLTAYAIHSGPIETFWQTLAAQPHFQNHIEGVQLTLQLGALTGNHLPLVNVLWQKQEQGEISTLTDLARLDEAGWLELIQKAGGVPPGAPGEDESAKASNYAKVLSHRAEGAFPSAFIAHRLKDGDLPGAADLAAFLNANPDFHLPSMRLGTYLQQNSNVLVSAETRAGLQALQRVYKVAPRYEQASALLKDGVDSAYAITRMGQNSFLSRYSDAAGSKELKKIYSKAQEVEAKALTLAVEYGRAGSKTSLYTLPDEAVLEVEGVPEWSSLFGSIELCGCEHCRSVYSPAAYLVDLLHFLDARASKVANQSAKDILFQRRPDLGEIELTCANTNTPLPYVDLVLEALETAVAPFVYFKPFHLAPNLEEDLNSRTLSNKLKKSSDTLKSAFDPELSTEAVITVGGEGKPWDVAPDWWTIDEPAFTYTLQKDGQGKINVVARSRQTKGSVAERAANPQYVNAEAYDTLRQAVYPWSLPFDLWAEEARAYLGHLGVPRFQIMESFQSRERADVLVGAALAREHLGLTSAQADLITGATDPGTWKLWGFASATLSAQSSIPDPSDSTQRIKSGNWLTVLTGRVDIFLQQSGLKYKELLDLLGTHFVNPMTRTGRKIQIVSTDLDNPDTCETDKLRLVGFDEIAAARTVRFVRLWRALGWSLRDLDRAVTAFDPTNLHDDFLICLSHVQRLQGALGVPVPRLLAWWANLDTAFYIDHSASGQPRAASVYDQLFRNRAVINPPDHAFTEDPAGLDGKLTDHSAAITAALRLSAADFARLLADPNIVPQGAALTLQNLSRLHRHASLAKALRLPVREYLAALAIVDPTPFATTTDTLIFVETVDKVRDAGFTFAELAYLLCHTSTPESPIAPGDEIIAAFLGELRTGLQTIAADNTFRADPDDTAGPTIDLNGDLTRQKLALLNWEPALIDQVIATLNGSVVYEAKLADMAVVFTVDLVELPEAFPPAELDKVIDCDEVAQTLTAARFLSLPERAQLQAAAEAATSKAVTAAEAATSKAVTAAVAALLQKQDELQAVVGYDAQRHVLQRTGAMTSGDKAVLDGASDHPDYQAAVEILYDAPRRFVRRALRTFAVHDFAIDLTALPTGIEIPKALGRKIYFEADSGRLHCLGAMTEQERNALLVLSTNLVYQKAVEDLYDQAETLPVGASDAFLTETDVAALFDAPVAPADRFLFVLEKLFPYLRRTLGEQHAIQKMAEALQLEARSTDALLRTWLDSPMDQAPEERHCLAELLDPAFAESHPGIQLTPAAFPAQFETFLRVHRAAMVTARFKLSHRQLVWLFTYGPDAGWLDLNTLPVEAQDTAAAFDGWLRLADLVRLRDSLPGREKALDDLLARAHGGASQEDWQSAVADWTGWPPADLETLLGTTFFGDALDERLLLRLREVFGLLKRLGLSAQQAADLAAGDVTQTEARQVRQAVRSKYDEAQWLNLAKPLRDVLREKQRAALVTYLISHLNLPGLRDANDLYAHFLIDVEMTPCMITSRIKQALSSVQLFVQRCFLNLEPDVAASAAVDDKWREWRWMKNYRVWEANRKVFLYPENWIEPELRDGKSPFFVELESELLQSDLTLQTAEDALLHYLNKLDQVAHLEVVAICHQVEEDSAGQAAVDILHVFARTNGTPHVYFYRQRVDSAWWTGWERLDLDIEGEHLIPVVWNRRLYLFWPIFTPKAEELSGNIAADAGNMEVNEYWEIKLAWSERKQDAWTSKRISKECSPPIYYALGPLKAPFQFLFRTLVDDHNNLNVVLSCPQVQAVPYYGILVVYRKLTFRFDSCHAEPIVIMSPEGSPYPPPPLMTATVYDRMFYRETGESMLYLPAPTDTEALAITPGTFRLLPYSDGTSIAEHPFFYLDDTRMFFVFPVEVPVPVIDEPPKIDQGQYEVIVWEVPDFSGPVINPSDPRTNEPSFPVQTTIGMIGGTQLSDDILLGGNPRVQGKAESTGTGLQTAETISVDAVAEAGSVPQSTSQSETTNPAWQTMLLQEDETSGSGWNDLETEDRFRFQIFYHPYVCAFVRELNRNGVDGLLQRPIQTHPQEFALLKPDGQPLPKLKFKKEYDPQDIIDKPYPKEDVDFAEDGAYALYNWELFFHAPLLIADRLSKNQRYEEAQKWFHYIFDPTDASSLETPKRFWRTKPFHERTHEGYQHERIQYILGLLAAGAHPEAQDHLSPEEKEDLARFDNAVAAWRKDPFKPHLIARLRTTAYQKNVVMKYLDNLIAWADQLFRRDTLESINEATQLYILAAEILGRRPEDVPPRAIPRVQTYNSLEPVLDSFSNALVQIEDFVSPSAGRHVVMRSGQPPLPTLPLTLYFCIPQNDKLLGYWDTVADRLFKIRHCMNIEGVVRQLPLFEPPIDPALLVKAAAAGVDFGSVLNDVSAGPPHYRFNVLAQKATELCGELKSLGQALLSALEKKDAERLSLLRAEHETGLLELVEEVRKQQIEEAMKNHEVLNKTRALAGVRYIHYQKLLGVQNPEVSKEIGEDIDIKEEPSQHIAISEEGGFKMIPAEKSEMAMLQAAADNQDSAADWEFAASFANSQPTANISPIGVGISFGGSNIGAMLSAFANRSQARAAKSSYVAGNSGKLGQYAFRAHDWLLQSTLAAHEIMQIDQQILAAELRYSIAVKELNNHQRQIDNAREVEDFLRDKYTNEELYGWMLGRLTTVYFQTYQLAYDLAKRAERAFRHELALKDSSFIQFGSWESLRKGLLAGERLFHDLKRMEVAYLDQHRREYEITKHVSVSQLDPLALIQLRQTGSCIVRLPEALFDLDFPGHYMRRIKSVGVSIPCVTGPYTGVCCTLTLLKSAVRHGNTLAGNNPTYARQEGDPRFTDSVGAIQSIVTSRAQDDRGLFEANLRDERFLPFEGAGVISEWQIELPGTFRQFDYDTISDVILHVGYTAREGGGALKQKAIEELEDALNEFVRSEGQQGLAQIVSPRHELPTEWHRFLNPPADVQIHTLPLALDKERFPFLFAHRILTITAIELFFKMKEGVEGIRLTLDDQDLALAPWNGLLWTSQHFNEQKIPRTWTLHAWRDGENGPERLAPDVLQELVVIVRYTLA
jgi:hypothetical protein